MPSLDPFRRFRLFPNPSPLSSNEDDSDEFSPEHDHPRVIHIAAQKHARNSDDRFLNTHRNGTIPHGTHKNTSEGAHISFSFRQSPDVSHLEREKHGVVSDPVPVLQPPPKSSLIRRVTSKLHISIPLRSTSDGLRSRPSTRTVTAEKKPPIPVSPTLPNSFVSKQHREAALRERGLRPPLKDLSEQEREADARIGSIPSPISLTFGGSTEAERLKSTWLEINRTPESSESGCGPLVPPYSQAIEQSIPPPDRHSGEGIKDLPGPGRPSICSSLPRLSTSFLEVLHEDPSELGPITPPPPLSPAHVPIIVSSPVEYPSTPIIAESPISCTFSSHCPGSTLESLSQSDHHSVREKERVRSRAARRRTSDSYDRPYKGIGVTLTMLGTRSLSNLRRSVTDLGRTSTSSVDLPVQAPRTAISPTIHSLGSILKETRDIEDAESRRLSELAFLD